jgi:hypothetical protein
MSITYITGFVLFVIGILISQTILLKAGAMLLLLTAVFYNWNVLKLMTRKPKLV